MNTDGVEPLLLRIPILQNITLIYRRRKTMKRFLCALLAVVMLCTMAVSMVSCFASIDGMEKNCKKLKEDGVIVEYEVEKDNEFLKAMKAVATIEAMDKDGKMFSAVEFEDKDTAKEYFEKMEESLQKMEDAGVDVSEYVLKRDGKIVISATSKDLYKKIA